MGDCGQDQRRGLRKQIFRLLGEPCKVMDKIQAAMPSGIEGEVRRQDIEIARRRTLCGSAPSQERERRLS